MGLLTGESWQLQGRRSAAGVSFCDGNDFEIDARLASASGGGTSGHRSPGRTRWGRFSAGVDVMTEGRFNVRLEAHAGRGADREEYGGQVRVEYRF